jgi:AdoMet-dependent heme synthase
MTKMDARRAYQKTDVFLPELPVTAGIEITRNCNAKCRHCSAGLQSFHIAEPDQKTMDRLVAEVMTLQPFQVDLFGGEPFLSRYFFPLAQYFQSEDISISASSNGAPVTQRLVDRLTTLDNISVIQISLDSLDPASHDAFRGVPGLFERAVGALEMLCASGITTGLSFTAHGQNVDELENVISFAYELGVASVSLSTYVATGDGDDALNLSASQMRYVYDLCGRARDRDYDGPSLATCTSYTALLDPILQKSPLFTGCTAGKSALLIRQNGDVIPCVHLDIVVGNCLNEPLVDIMTRAPLIVDMNDRNNLKGACGSCDFKVKCGGCRARAYAATGDPLAEDPGCFLPLMARKERAAALPLGET